MPVLPIIVVVSFVALVALGRAAQLHGHGSGNWVDPDESWGGPREYRRWKRSQVLYAGGKQWWITMYALRPRYQDGRSADEWGYEIGTYPSGPAVASDWGFARRKAAVTAAENAAIEYVTS